jgi:ribosomal protein S18 acetylase RimI-like enzyme
MSVIKNSRKEDLEEIAVCHKSAFPDSLSSQMGISYLKKMLEWYLSDDKKFLFHIEENGKCVGYCGGMIDDGLQATGSASGMIQYSFNDAVRSIMLRPWLLFHKELLAKYKLIKKNIKLKMKKKAVPGKTETKKRNEARHEIQTGLVVIGVSREAQGKGYGSLLLQEFENKTKRLNIKAMSLTVRNDNNQAIKSYERNGWVRFKLNGNSLEMVKKLD